MSIRSHLEAMDDIVVVKERTDPHLGVTPHLSAHPESPVMFENMVGGGRLVANVWSTRSRIATALGTDVPGLTHLIAGAMAAPKPFKWVRDADLLDNQVDKVDLRKLPIPTFYPSDGGPYITAGVFVAEWEGVRNLSFHRVMVTGPRTATVRVVPRHLYALHRRAKARGKDLPVAVAIGSCPPVLIAAGCSVGLGQDELGIASAIRMAATDKPVDVVRLPGSGLAAPATAELVLEGRLTGKDAAEGPFVDITGTIDPAREQPVLEVDRIYHRTKPILHAILPGGLEHYMLMGLPKEPAILKSVMGVVPEVRGVRLTEGGCCWLHAVVSIKAQKQGDAKNAILAAFAGHASLKRVIVVDDDIDPFDDRQVEWALATRFQAHDDMLVIEGARGSTLDPSASGTTSKLGLDATVPMDADRGLFKRLM